MTMTDKGSASSVTNESSGGAPHPEGFSGRIGRTYHDSEPWWPSDPTAAGRPDVIFVVLDDMGFGSLGCYGSEIETPNIDRLAVDGVQFTNFHATALCSPTRACLLTGRNHHAVGMAYLSHVDDGYPGYRGRITHRAATVAEMLVDQGYNTMAVGKWHLAPMDQTTAVGPYDQWPLGRGFERYYGFLEALTDHYYPELYQDNHVMPPPADPRAGYHLSEDLVDRSIEFIRNRTSIAPERPYFLYLAFGATHTPFQAPPEYVAKYRGRYDEGWDVIRERRYQRQLEMGVIPPETELPPRNDNVQPWEDLSDDEKRLYPKFQEIYSAFLDHTDTQIGRLLDYLEEIGRLDNTIVVLLGDNGASQEGGPHGVIDTTAYENGHFTSLEHNLARADEIDGFTTHVNYPLGWAQAGNSPLKRYKQNTHAGGIRTSMILRLPGRAHAGERRGTFQHVTDIVPTVLDYLDLPAPSTYRGIDQMPLHGRSIRPVLEDPHGSDAPRTQYFETDGHRAVYSDGWKAVAYHRRGEDFDSDEWELYHLAEDFSEAHDLAAEQPQKLAELIDLWWAEAERNQVLPLDDRGFAERANANFRPHSPRDRNSFVYRQNIDHIGTAAAPPVAGRSYRIVADVREPGEGVLIAHGSTNSGYALMVRDGHLVFDYNYYGDHRVLTSTERVPDGPARLAMEFHIDPESTAGTATLLIGDRPSGELRLDETFEFFVAFQGLDIGADRLSPVREHAEGQFEFTGEFDSVTVQILDDDRGAFQVSD
jgi:arylsulfatase